MCDCDQNRCQCHGNSGFVFGLIIGAIIAAIIAIVIYRNDKSDILSTLQYKLSKFFSDFISNPTSSNQHPTSVRKKPVIIPEATQKVIAMSTPKPGVKAKPRTFIKAKR